MVQFHGNRSSIKWNKFWEENCIEKPHRCSYKLVLLKMSDVDMNRKVLRLRKDSNWLLLIVSEKKTHQRIFSRVHYDEATPVRMVLPLRLEHPKKMRRTIPCGSVCDDKNIRHIEFETVNAVWWLSQIWLSKRYFLLPWGWEGSPWGEGWVLRHLRRVARNDKSERISICIILRGLFHSLSTKRRLHQIWLSRWYF